MSKKKCIERLLYLIDYGFLNAEDLVLTLDDYLSLSDFQEILEHYDDV